MKENILIIMMGSSRGGKYARKTQEKYLIKHLKADVAICFGDVDDIQDSFINTANYNWNFKDYDNWRTYFNNHYSENLINNLEKGKDTYLMGGIDSYSGSGAIIFAIRDILLRNHIDIIEKYDQVILTRSDYIYVDYHPKLNNKEIWVVEGEDYFGITDRHYVFPGKEAENILGICNYLDKENIYKEWKEPKNPEIVLQSYFKNIKIFDKIKRFQRTQMVVKNLADSTTTREGVKLFFFKDLYAKKVGEFEESMKNLTLFQQFTYLNFLLKINYYLFQVRKLINNITKKLLNKRIFTQ